MSNMLKEYRKQAKAEALEKRSQFGQQPSHPAPSPPASEYHSTASVDGEMEIGDSVSQVNQLHIICSALRARPLSSDGKMMGTIWRELPIFK